MRSVGRGSTTYNGSHLCVACLLDSAKDSLEELELTPSPVHEFYEHNTTSHDLISDKKAVSTKFIGSLQAFKNLKHLNICRRLLQRGVGQAAGTRTAIRRCSACSC